MRAIPGNRVLRKQTLKTYLLRTRAQRITLLTLEQVSIQPCMQRISYLLISTLAVHPSALYFRNLSGFFFFFFSMLVVTSTFSCVGPQNKTGQPAHRYTKLIDAGSRVECPRNINRLQDIVFLFLLSLRSEIVHIICLFQKDVFYEILCVLCFFVYKLFDKLRTTSGMNN